MPRLTVIDGGQGYGRGPNDPGSRNARYVLEDLFVEVLRAVARGHDGQSRLAKRLAAFADVAPTLTRPLDEILNEVLLDFTQRITPEEASRYETLRELKNVMFASLYLAAEMGATDNGAKGRAGRRQSQLLGCFERAVVRREIRRNNDKPKPRGKKKP